MYKKFIFFILFLLFGQLLFAQYQNLVINQQELFSLCESCMKNIQKQDFDSALELFHFPPGYTDKELKKDKEAVLEHILLFNNEFGKIITYKPNQGYAEYYHLMAGGGDIVYWGEHPRNINLVYEVEFDKEGPGIVNFVLNNVTGDWEIQMIGYGLLASNKDAKKRIDEIYKKME